jgi:hypothetical protein
MEVKIIKRKRKKPEYGLKILSTAIQRKGRVIGNLSQKVEFIEDVTYGNTEILFS